MEIIITLDMTLDLVETNVIINNIWVEYYFEVDIFMRTNESLSRVDAEKLLTKRQVPAKLSTNVS